MTITLASLKIKLSFMLGTTEQNLFTNDKRVYALNRAIRNVLEKYDIPQYTVRTSLLFSNGVTDLPTDCLRPFKLADSKNYEYEEVDFDKFDYNIPTTYTIKYDTVSGLEKIYTFPAPAGSLNFTYIQNQPTLLLDADTVRFRDWWEDALAAKATEILLNESRAYNAGDVIGLHADDLIAQAWQNDRGRLTGKEDQKLTSVFIKKPLLRSWNFLNIASPFNTMSCCTSWTTINSDAVAQVNFGYNVDGGGLVTITLPPASSMGDVIEIVAQSAAGWKLAQGAGQVVHFGNVSTTIGPTGYLQSTQIDDAIRIECTVQNQEWVVLSSIGNITVV